MIDKGIKKKDLKVVAFIGNSTMVKSGNNANVTIGVLTKIYDVMKGTLDDIVEIIPDEE